MLKGRQVTQVSSELKVLLDQKDQQVLQRLEVDKVHKVLRVT